MGLILPLCAVLAVDALGKEHVRAYGLPSSYTAMSSIEDAQECASRLGIMFELLSIEEGFSVFAGNFAGAVCGS